MPPLGSRAYPIHVGAGRQVQQGMPPGRQCRAFRQAPCREDGFRPGDVPFDAPGKLRDLGAERGHFGGAAAMFQRVVVALWRAALARNGIVPFVRRKIFFCAQQTVIGRPAKELFRLFGRKIFFCGRQAVIGRAATELFGLFGRKNSIGTAEDAGAGERPGGGCLPAEATMAPGVAVAGRRAAPALRRGFGHRSCGQAHKISTSSFCWGYSQYRTDMQFTNCYSVAEHATHLPPDRDAHAEAAEKIKVAMGRGQPSATDVEGGCAYQALGSKRI